MQICWVLSRVKENELQSQKGALGTHMPGNSVRRLKLAYLHSCILRCDHPIAIFLLLTSHRAVTHPSCLYSRSQELLSALNDCFLCDAARSLQCFWQNLFTRILFPPRTFQRTLHNTDLLRTSNLYWLPSNLLKDHQVEDLQFQRGNMSQSMERQRQKRLP